jgi:AraC-like DNA-binding protein
MRTYQLNNNYNYQEISPAGFSEAVEKVWRIIVNENCIYRAIPDNSVDVVWESKNKRAFMLVSSSTYSDFELQLGEIWTGIRFYPGMIHTLLPLGTIVNDKYEFKLQDILPSLYESLCTVSSTDTLAEVSEVVRIILEKFSNNNKPPSVLMELLCRMYQEPNLKHYQQFVKEVSQRQMLRYFNQYVGVSPKQFMRVARLQTYIYEVKHGNTEIAHVLYYDQSHLIKEVKQLTGLSVAELLRQVS